MDASEIAEALSVRDRPLWYQLLYHVSCVLYILLCASFFLLRGPEFLAVYPFPLYKVMFGVLAVGIATLFVTPPKTASLLARRFGLVSLVLVQFKQELDKGPVLVQNPLQLVGKICIVTGANSGIGLSVSKLLYNQGATVVMACRNTERCESAAKSITTEYESEERDYKPGFVNVMAMDMSDLASIKSFVGDFQAKYDHLDYLVLNAGLIPNPSERTAQGLEAAFGVMHVGNVALTKWLLKSLLVQPPNLPSGSEISASRVLYVGSSAYLMGSFHSSLLSGAGNGDLNGEITDNCGTTGPGGLVACCPAMRCPHTNGYARAKLANILHVHELQRRVDAKQASRAEAALGVNALESPRRLVTSVFHPGTVSTPIHPFLGSSIVSWFIRSPEVAARHILNILQREDYVPGAFIDATGRAHDLQGYQETLMETHLVAHPHARALSFTHRRSIDIFSFDEWWFKTQRLCWDCVELAGYERVGAATVAARLWDVTEGIIAAWEAGKAPFERALLASTAAL